MSTTASMIYNICLLAVWTAFLWKNLTPRFSFRVTMLICAVVVPAVVLGVNYGLNRLSVLRLISVPLLFLILGLTLYRSPIPLTAFVALLPEATLLMMEMMLSVVFPMLFGLNGEVDYWHTAAAEPLALLTVSLYAGTLALATWALSRNGRPLSLTFDQQPQTTGTEDDSPNQNQGQQDSYGDLYDYFFGRGNGGRGN